MRIVMAKVMGEEMVINTRTCISEVGVMMEMVMRRLMLMEMTEMVIRIVNVSVMVKEKVMGIVMAREIMRRW